MNKIHVSTLTSIILASAVMVSQVNAEETFESPVNINPQPLKDYAGTIYTSTWLTAGSSDEFLIQNSTNDQTALLVSSTGNVNLANIVYFDRDQVEMGIGTTAPEETLHVKGNGNLLLEGDASKWKINTRADGGILFRDMLSSNDPFSIDASAPTDSLNITDNGNIGMGTSSPVAKLDVRGDIEATWSGSNTVNDGLTTLATLSADNSESGKVSDAGFRLENADVGFIWDFRTLETAEGFAATKLNTGGPEFRVDNLTSDHHNAKVSMGGVVIFENGQLQTPSSRALKTNIKPLDTQAALEAFHDLQPVSYAYKAHKDEPVVGFIAEDIPELVATKTRTGIDSTEILAVLTKVVQEQDIQLKAQAEKIAKLETMQKRLVKVESLLTNLALDTSNTKKEKVSLNTKP